MRKNRIIAVVLCGLILAPNAFSKTAKSDVTISEEDRIINAMLINHLLYAIETVKHYENRLIVEQEYNIIFDKIDMNRLNDERLLKIYTEMLGTLTAVKLQDNERVFLQQQAAKEKKESLYKTLQNTALSSIYGIQQIGTGIGQLTSKDPAKGWIQIVQGATSLAYSGVSAYFNYRNAVSAVENQLNKDLFKINQEKLKVIASQSERLWNTSVNVVNAYANKEYIIRRDQLEWLVKTLDGAESDEKIHLLDGEKQRETFAIFTPYWYELGCAYQESASKKILSGCNKEASENYNKALECYAEFERQKKSYSILDNDPYYTELAKNTIWLIQNGKADADINTYMNIIKKDKTASSESENKLYLASIYESMDDKKNALECLKWIIDNRSYDSKYIGIARDFYESIVAEENEKFKYVFMLNQLKISSLEVKKSCCAEQKDFIKMNKISDYAKESNLAFVLPCKLGARFKLDIIDENVLYDSVAVDYKDKNLTFYFVNRNEKDLLSKINNLRIVLTDEKADEFLLNYKVSYFESKKVKLLDESFEILNDGHSELSLDYSDFEHVNIAHYVQNFESYKQQQKKEKSTDGVKKAEEVTKIYEKAAKAFLTEPYLYRNNILVFDKQLISYGLDKIEIKNSQYSISKYGDVIYERETAKVSEPQKNLYKKAVRGDADAMYQYGYTFLVGENTSVDYIEAIRWFKLAANKKNADAYVQLGRCFDKGLGVKQDKNRAKYYFAEAVKLGSSEALRLLSDSSRSFVFYETTVACGSGKDDLKTLSSDRYIAWNVNTPLIFNLQIKPRVEGSIKSNTDMPAKLIVSTTNDSFLMKSESVFKLNNFKNTYENSDNVFEFSINPSVARGNARFRMFSKRPCTVTVKIIYEDTSKISVGDPSELYWTVQFK